MASQLVRNLVHQMVRHWEYVSVLQLVLSLVRRWVLLWGSRMDCQLVNLLESEWGHLWVNWLANPSVMQLGSQLRGSCDPRMVQHSHQYSHSQLHIYMPSHSGHCRERNKFPQALDRSHCHLGPGTRGGWLIGECWGAGQLVRGKQATRATPTATAATLCFESAPEPSSTAPACGWTHVFAKEQGHLQGHQPAEEADIYACRSISQIAHTV